MWIKPTFFNNTFKTNPHLERAIMTGITRISKESFFSDLNNLSVVGVTSDMYADTFGFTEEEVFTALDEMVLSDKKGQVKDGHEPERFYHGLVLGLLVSTTGRYDVRSNRESGLGRYDVMMIPKKKNPDETFKDDGIIIEFKPRSDGEETLEDTAKRALDQIEDKKYKAELIAQDIPDDKIRCYGFGFEGKEVKIHKG